MKPFTRLEAIAAPFDVADVDTDKLIPHRFLRKPLSAGYRNFLFHELRFSADGVPDPDFVLHREPYARAGILVTGPNFGCGSAREAAVYALADFGIGCVIAPSFADVFKANCLQTGLLPVELPTAEVKALCRELETRPGLRLTVDLQQQEVIVPGGQRHRFRIDPTRRIQLLEGLDDIGLTLRQEEELVRFESAYRARMSWLYPSIA